MIKMRELRVRPQVRGFRTRSMVIVTCLPNSWDRISGKAVAMWALSALA